MCTKYFYKKYLHTIDFAASLCYYNGEKRKEHQRKPGGRKDGYDRDSGNRTEPGGSEGRRTKGQTGEPELRKPDEPGDLQKLETV